MKRKTKQLIKQLNTFLLTLTLVSSSVGITSFAAYEDDTTVIVDETVGGINSVEDDEILTALDSTDKVAIATANNVPEVVFDSNMELTVNSAEGLKEAFALAEDGAKITIEEDIYLTEALSLNNSVTLEATSEVTIFSAKDQRHFFVTGDEIALTMENVILNGNGVSGGIQSNANYLTLSNAVISNCVAVRATNRSYYGGAVYAEEGELTIINSEIKENSAKTGGGIYGNTVTISDSKITANVANSGGGVKATDLVLVGSTVTYNYASADNGTGGGIMTTNGTISNSEIYYNYAEYGGGGLYFSIDGSANVSDSLFAYNVTRNWGAGIYALYTDTINVINCEFFGNNSKGFDNSGVASNAGGGMYIEGDYLYVFGSEFSDNESSRGAGLFSRTTSTHISNCKFLDNYADLQGGGIYNYIFPGDDVLIEDSNIRGNYANNGGGVYASLHGEDPNTADMMISNCQIINNDSGNGGGVYALRGLVRIGNNSVVKNNFADYAYLLDSEEDVILHNQMIDDTVTWTEPFDYIYNNLDVVYFRGERVAIQSVTVVESYGVTGKVESFPVLTNRSFHYDFELLSGCEVSIESNFDDLLVDLNASTIDIEAVKHSGTIFIMYKDVAKQHTITVTLRYLDGILPDETTSYQVSNGTDFAEAYQALEGYKLAGASARSSFIHVDGVNQMVYIENVTRNYDVVVYLEPEAVTQYHTVTVTIKYPKGTIEDQVTVYQVEDGATFEEIFKIEAGYSAVGTELEIGMDVFFWIKTIRVDSVTKDMSATIFCE